MCLHIQIYIQIQVCVHILRFESVEYAVQKINGSLYTNNSVELQALYWGRQILKLCRKRSLSILQDLYILYLSAIAPTNCGAVNTRQLHSFGVMGWQFHFHSFVLLDNIISACVRVYTIRAVNCVDCRTINISNEWRHICIIHIHVGNVSNGGCY